MATECTEVCKDSKLCLVSPTGLLEFVSRQGCHLRCPKYFGARDIDDNFTNTKASLGSVEHEEVRFMG